MNGRCRSNERLFLKVLKLSCAALLLMPSVALPTEPVAPTEFPGPSRYFGLARVAAQSGGSLRFAQLLEYHCNGASCADSDLFVENGDRLVTGAADGKLIHVWFREGGKYLRGWFPAANVKALAFAPHPGSDKWLGIWTVGEFRKIIINAHAASSTLSITARAEWHGGPNGEVIHTGDVQGEGVPHGNRLVIRGSLPDDCVLELELVDEFLGAEDNMHCGGMNVSFSDVYTRDAIPRAHSKISRP